MDENLFQLNITQYHYYLTYDPGRSFIFQQQSDDNRAHTDTKK